MSDQKEIKFIYLDRDNGNETEKYIKQQISITNLSREYIVKSINQALNSIFNRL